MHVTADTYVHGNDFINALIAHLHVCLDMCIALGHIGTREGGALGERVNAPTLTILSLRPTCQAHPALLIHLAERGATTAVPAGRLQMRVVLQV
jgi:hypothetical protein